MGVANFQPRASQPKLDRNTQIILLVLVVAVVAVFCSRSLWNGFVRDDVRLVLHNRSPGGLLQWLRLWVSRPRAGANIFFRPVEGLWFHLNLEIVGRSAVGWHAIRVLLHLGVVLLVFGVVRSLIGSVGSALLAALLFGLLPSHDEAIAWVTTPEPVAAALEIAAFWLVIRAARAGRTFSAGGVALFALAAFTFEGAIVFPLLIFLYFLLLDSGASASGGLTLSRSRLIHAVRASVPFLLVAAFYLERRIAVFHTRGLPLGAGSDPVHPAHSMAQVAATIPAVVLDHLLIVILGWECGPVHPLRWVNGPGSAGFFLPLTLLVCGGLTFLIAIWRSPRRNLYLFFALWFFVCLTPMLNLNYLEPETAGVNGFAPVQDRWTYLSSLGWCVLLAEGILFVNGQVRAIRVPALTLGVGLIAFYGITLWRCEYYWRSNQILMARVGEIDPDSPEFLSVRGLQLESKGDWKAAEEDLQELVRLRPDKPLYHFYLFRAELHLGNSAAAATELEKSRATTVDENDPGTEPPAISPPPDGNRG
jgi:hypothetical protein